MLGQPISTDLCDCPQLLKLAVDGKIRYEWHACGCSPMERSYQLLDETSNWVDFSYCAFCGSNIPVGGLPMIVGVLDPNYRIPADYIDSEGHAHYGNPGRY